MNGIPGISSGSSVGEPRQIINRFGGKGYTPVIQATLIISEATEEGPLLASPVARGRVSAGMVVSYRTAVVVGGRHAYDNALRAGVRCVALTRLCDNFHGWYSIPLVISFPLLVGLLGAQIVRTGGAPPTDEIPNTLTIPHVT